MQVARMRRGWRLRLTDNEMELLSTVVALGLDALNGIDKDVLPYKVRKVFLSNRWRAPHGPLVADDDRRSASSAP